MRRMTAERWFIHIKSLSRNGTRRCRVRIWIWIKGIGCGSTLNEPFQIRNPNPRNPKEIQRPKSEFPKGVHGPKVHPILEVGTFHEPLFGARTALSARSRQLGLADMAVRAPIDSRFLDREQVKKEQGAFHESERRAPSRLVSKVGIPTSTVTNKFRYLRGLDFLALPRRERRAYPSWVCKERATTAAPKKTATRRAAPELSRGFVTPRSQSLQAMLPRRASPEVNSGAAQVTKFICHGTSRLRLPRVATACRRH